MMLSTEDGMIATFSLSPPILAKHSLAIHISENIDRIGAYVELEQLASCLEKLGNHTRLGVYRLLVRAGRDGLAVGEIQARLGVPASTLSHHILCLVSVGLVKQEREGRVLRCKPNYDLMNAIVKSLTAECCTGVPGRAEPVSAKPVKGGGRRAL